MTEIRRKWLKKIFLERFHQETHLLSNPISCINFLPRSTMSQEQKRANGNLVSCLKKSSVFSRYVRTPKVPDILVAHDDIRIYRRIPNSRSMTRMRNYDFLRHQMTTQSSQITQTLLMSTQNKLLNELVTPSHDLPSTNRSFEKKSMSRLFDVASST